MNEFMKTLLSLSVSGTLLLLLIWGLKQLYKNKFSRRWQYYIWMIAALRFLLPFTPDTTLVGSLFKRFDSIKFETGKLDTIKSDAVNYGAIGSGAAEFDAAGITNELSTSPNASVSVNVDNGGAEPVQTDKDAAAAMRGPLNIYVCLFFIWSVPALVLFVRKVTVYQGFLRYIKAGSTEVSDIGILNLLSDHEEKLNIKTRVELSCNPLIASPMLIGFFRPGIILPVGGLKERELSYIFLHELIHYKQKDMFYKWLIQTVVCVHWFNPFVYLLEKEVNNSCELSCDERVISILGDTARREYGDMLLSFLKSDNPCKNSLASVTLTEGAEQLKERLGAIMKFKKKSKTVRVITAICTAAVSSCFLAAGAYAAPSADNKLKKHFSDLHSDDTQGEVWQDDEILNETLSEDGVYYIFCDGAGENDKPQSSVSAGSVQFVLVRKDSFTSIGPFSDLDTLTEQVSKQCDYMSERGQITEEEKKLVLDTAKKAENNKAENDREHTYTYMQRSYYSNAYIIEMGWNLNNKMRKAYPDSKEITLKDNSTILVYFGGLPYGSGNGNVINYMNDSDALSAIGELIYSLKNSDMPNCPTLETPLVTNITYVGEKDLPTLAEEYYANDSLTAFSAVFPVLDIELQKDYLQKIYDNDKISFFAAVIPCMDRDIMMLYADKAEQDGKINFFSVMLPDMPSDVINLYADRYYEADDTSGFAVIIPYMTKSEKQEWLAKAQADKKSTFAAILSNRLFD